MDLIITILSVVTKDLPISPRFTPYTFLSRCKFSTLTTRQPMVEFYLLTFPRFPLRKKEHKSYSVRIELTTSALAGMQVNYQTTRATKGIHEVYDPTTQGYRPGGFVGHVARCQESRLGVKDCSSLFLAIPFGRTVITLYTPLVPHRPRASLVQVSSMEGLCCGNSSVLAVRTRFPFCLLLL